MTHFCLHLMMLVSSLTARKLSNCLINIKASPEYEQQTEYSANLWVAKEIYQLVTEHTYREHGW